MFYPLQGRTLRRLSVTSHQLRELLVPIGGGRRAITFGVTSRTSGNDQIFRVRFDGDRAWVNAWIPSTKSWIYVGRLRPGLQFDPARSPLASTTALAGRADWTFLDMARPSGQADWFRLL